MSLYYQNPPFTCARIYNENKCVKLRGRVWYATFRGEDVHLALASPLGEEALQDLADYLKMWRQNDYVHIYFYVANESEAPGFEPVLRRLGVKLLFVPEGTSDAVVPVQLHLDLVSAPLLSSTFQEDHGAETYPELSPVG